MQSIENTEWENQTTITKFILLGFRNLPELQIPLFLLFLISYFVTMAGNFLIFALVVGDQQLHTPMYFFLGNFSCLEISYTSTILPRMLASLLTNDKTISFRGCMVQMYFFLVLGVTECYLLAAMSYDRYLAICKPLHYANLMNSRFCLLLAAGSWISAFLAISIIVLLVSQLTFCGPSEIDHFFCDLTPVLKLARTDTHLMELTAFIFALIFTLSPFILTVLSYVAIIAIILRISSATGKQKAFSTCSSHLMVVIAFYGTLTIVYVLPKNDTLRDLNKVFSVFYTVLSLLLNPLIYSLRNWEVKEGLRKGLSKFVLCTRMQTL
ncbi:LOW QUALITY PROTEIN: olfactory receptor 10A7 [Chrysemys picta bellii]|uniref:LOW QUALITY PROTEIN: olfactory receptor 10A7 n=1 Tax=Chrysemys picta bellii TaxID=8478 RepID=UPI0032B25EBB